MTGCFSIVLNVCRRVMRTLRTSRTTGPRTRTRRTPRTRRTRRPPAKRRKQRRQRPKRAKRAPKSKSSSRRSRNRGKSWRHKVGRIFFRFDLLIDCENGAADEGCEGSAEQLEEDGRLHRRSGVRGTVVQQETAGMDGLMCWLTDGRIDRLTDQLIYWWLVDGWIDWFIDDWLMDGLID